MVMFLLVLLLKINVFYQKLFMIIVIKFNFFNNRFLRFMIVIDGKYDINYEILYKKYYINFCKLYFRF